MKYHPLFLLILLLSAQAFSQNLFSVYFDSNKYELTAKEQLRLNQWMGENPNVKIVGINGFCDEDGSKGFNDTLAQKRIQQVHNLIRDKVTIRDDFKTRSFGELHQLSTVKAENRKVTLIYLKPEELVRENEILGIKPPPPPVKKEVSFPQQMTFENPDGSKSEYRLDVDFMKKLYEAKAGEKLKIDNLNFKINTFIVVPESRGKLYELLLVLQKNPAMKIEIQGHLCCMPVDRLDLSTQRAKAVNNFLINNGINEERITYKGFGSSQPIYPIPEKDEMQRAANRRVEILVMAND